MNDFIVTSVSFDDHSFLAAAFYEDRMLSELTMEADNRQNPSLVGRIYRGYVEKVARNTGGAFVRIGKMETFLPGTKAETKTGTRAEERNHRLRASTPITVMVTKDAAGVKQPVVTENLRLAGRFAVVSSKPG